jgi:cell wall-associated NlpC family hydrolase
VAPPHLALRHALTPNHPTPCPGTRRSRAAARLRSGLLVGATATFALTLLPGTAAAVPGEATTPQQAARLVAEASEQLEVVSEQVNTAREELKTQRAAVDAAEKAAGRAEDQLDALDGQIRQIARSAYTSDGLSQIDVLLTSDSAEDFVSQLGTLDAIAGHTSDVVDQVSDAADQADRARTRAEAATKDAQQTLDDVTAKQDELEHRKADYQRQYARLTAEQRRQVSEARAGRAVAAPAPARAPVRAPAPVAAAAPVAAPSGAAGAAVSTALAQVGDPYVWGAAGPDAFDCSGLTQYAYAAAGVALPHSSSMQSQMGVPVSRSQLQPGDLVFFYSPVSHVGMYIGNGQMVHASTSGTPVQVVSLDSMPGYNSARRIT